MPGAGGGSERSAMAKTGRVGFWAMQPASASPRTTNSRRAIRMGASVRTSPVIIRSARSPPKPRPGSHLRGWMRLLVRRGRRGLGQFGLETVERRRQLRILRRADEQRIDVRFGRFLVRRLERPAGIVERALEIGLVNDVGLRLALAARRQNDEVGRDAAILDRVARRRVVERGGQPDRAAAL